MEAIAKLNRVMLSPRKARIVADTVRLGGVNECLVKLNYLNRKPAEYISKLIRSAMANWEVVNKANMDEHHLYVKSITVNTAGMLKRMMPAAQGRGNRIRKRMSNIEVVVDSLPYALF